VLRGRCLIVFSKERSKPHLIALALVVWRDALRRDAQSRLFPHFADHTCGAALAGLRCAPGNHPVPGLGTTQQHAVAAEHDGPRPTHPQRHDLPRLCAGEARSATSGHAAKRHDNPRPPSRADRSAAPATLRRISSARPTECGVVRILIGDDHVHAPHADNLVDEKP
jgi:hypothetical protein